MQGIEDARTFTQARFAGLMALCTELKNEAHQIMDSGVPRPVALRDQFAAFAFGKGYKSFLAVERLAQTGMREDASVIFRTLLDLAITMRYMLADISGERAERYFEHVWLV